MSLMEDLAALVAAYELVARTPKVKIVLDASAEAFPWLVCTRENKTLARFDDKRLAALFLLTAELIDTEAAETLHAELNPEG